MINNVISLATVPIILAKGAAYYRDYGVGRSHGTLPFQLAGNLKHGGLVEKAFGLTLRDLLYGFGGGSASAGRCAVQVGGPLGAYLPESQWDVPLDYEAYARISAMIGHGGLVAFDDTVDMARMARYAMEFCAVESCGKCTPCRIGSTRGVRPSTRSWPAARRANSRCICCATCATPCWAARCARWAAWRRTVLSALNHFPQDFGLADSPHPPPARPDAARPETAMLETVIKRDRDLGTPARESTQTVTLTIDGQEVTVPEGSSLMRAAAEAGINIPKLCATDSLEPFGSCRLCLVQIDGRRGYPASCTTPAEHGMVVHTETPKLRELRRGVMELYISDHPLDCLTCPANGDCELQDMAGVVGLREVRYGYQGANHLDSAKDESNPYFTYDPSKCIVCNRCVRACENPGHLRPDHLRQGLRIARVARPGPAVPGQRMRVLRRCVQACPTSTLQEKTVIMMGQAEHSVITTCAYCGVGCGFKAEMKGQEVVRMVPWKDGQANRGHSCVKGRFAWGYATHKERVLKPMIRQRITDPWREVSWDEAINHAASEFRRIQARHGRDAVGGITSSRCTNEETWLVQKLCARPSAPTTSTPAPASATRPPATA